MRPLKIGIAAQFGMIAIAVGLDLKGSGNPCGDGCACVSVVGQVEIVNRSSESVRKVPAGVYIDQRLKL